MYDNRQNSFFNWIFIPQQGALIRDILEGNFTSDDIEAAVSIIRTFPSRRQPGAGFGLEEQIGEVMELHDMLRRRPENSAEYFNESNGRVSNSLIADPHPHD